EQRELRVGRPASDDEAVDPERADREDQQERDRHVGDVSGHLVSADRPAGTPRDHREGGHRREGREERPEDVEHVDRSSREEALLADQLDEVGDRLQRPERPDAVRPVAQLHPAHDLALDERQVGEAEQHEVDDDHGLDERDPPRLAARAAPHEEPAHALTTSTSAWRSAACSSATRATPSTSVRSMRARSSTEVPFERIVTRSPLEMPRRPASPLESATSSSGRWNWSSATRSTWCPEKSGVYRSSRSVPTKWPSARWAVSAATAREGSGGTYAARAGSAACSPSCSRRGPP